MKFVNYGKCKGETEGQCKLLIQKGQQSKDGITLIHLLCATIMDLCDLIYPNLN